MLNKKCLRVKLFNSRETILTTLALTIVILSCVVCIVLIKSVDTPEVFKLACSLVIFLFLFIATVSIGLGGSKLNLWKWQSSLLRVGDKVTFWGSVSGEIGGVFTHHSGEVVSRSTDQLCKIVTPDQDGPEITVKRDDGKVFKISLGSIGIIPETDSESCCAKNSILNNQ